MNKTMKNIVNALFAVVFILLGTQLSYGQYAYFAESGKIEYEKRVNMFAKIKGRITEDDVFMKKLYEDYRKNQPQFVTMKTSLSFNKNQSLYQITEEPKTASNWFSNEPWIMVKNTILTNFESEDVVAVKKIFGEDFVLKDKQREILWKYTNEVREIAGFECKRANGLMMDSIYVVAFYTDEILASGGPESFSGLPGMILGVALPHENVTWFATKVEIDKPGPINNPEEPRRADHVDREGLKAFLEKNLGNWGRYGSEAVKASML
ncbi:GLPGLI family protein [Albibacterium indicum]|uniref:GLPGLI family protein n=1 Tax=Albibacterium indicum TaxID=2292082 RepID=UPI001FE94F86|nr:GLPGLI family protein [Pedobacter indicus]